MYAYDFFYYQSMRTQCVCNIYEQLNSSLYLHVLVIRKYVYIFATVCGKVSAMFFRFP